MYLIIKKYNSFHFHISLFMWGENKTNIYNTIYVFKEIYPKKKRKLLIDTKDIYIYTWHVFIEKENGQINK